MMESSTQTTTSSTSVDLKAGRRTKPALADPAKVDRLPPHSLEAEQGVLACVLLSPQDCMGECIERFKVKGDPGARPGQPGAEEDSSAIFYDLRHRTIYEAMVRLGEQHDAWDLILLQMNRDYEREPKKRKPRLSDLRESGAIEQDPDFVGLLYRPQEEDEAAGQPAGRAAPGVQVNLLIAKHRNGPTGEVLLTFLSRFTRFESAALIEDTDVPQPPKRTG